MTGLIWDVDKRKISPMSWDAKDVALLKKLWALGQSAAQIARVSDVAATRSAAG
jgi:hypothetical protein